jgi:hypothetical protein
MWTDFFTVGGKADQRQAGHGEGSEKACRKLTRPFYFYNTAGWNRGFIPIMVRCGTISGLLRPYRFRER